MISCLAHISNTRKWLLESGPQKWNGPFLLGWQLQIGSNAGSDTKLNPNLASNTLWLDSVSSKKIPLKLRGLNAWRSREGFWIKRWPNQTLEMQSKMWYWIVLKRLMRYLNPVQYPHTYNVILNSFEKVCIDFEKIFKSDSTSLCGERSGRSFPKGASPKRPTGGCRYTWHNNVWGK